DDINKCVKSEVQRVLEQENTSVLIFVYRTDWAESLAHALATSFGNGRIKKGDLRAIMDVGVAWYHAGMSAGSRASVRQALLEGKVRVVVSTTALAMGINLPTTHVFIRDITYPGVRELDIAELTQMMGRAGRGDKQGVGVVFHRPSDKIGRSVLEQGLKEEIYSRIVSQLSPPDDEIYYYGRKQGDLDCVNRVGNQILGIINRMGRITRGDLEKFLLLSWGGKVFLHHLDGLLQRLCQWKLVFFAEETGEFDLTRLGKTASRCYLPPTTAANMGQLIRDMLQDQPDGRHLVQMSPIDLLIMLCLTSSDLKPLARYSKSLAERVDSYMEELRLEEKSYLYRQWIAGDAAALLGSARVGANFKESEAHKVAYQQTHLAMFLYDLSKGEKVRNLEARYRVNVQEVEEKIRDIALWLLYGLEKIFEVRNFYFHLRAVCEVSPEQIKPVEVAFKRLSRLVFSLLPNLRYRSSLGELIRGIKNVYPRAGHYPGEGTIRRLEEGGVSNLRDLAGKSLDDLVKLGVQRRYAELIVGYIKRRMV
ncbi:MAG: helicase-related protein, partial [Bacillota bacterium]